MLKCYSAAHFVNQASQVYVAVLLRDLHLFVAQPSEHTYESLGCPAFSSCHAIP